MTSDDLRFFPRYEFGKSLRVGVCEPTAEGGNIDPAAGKKICGDDSLGIRGRERRFGDANRTRDCRAGFPDVFHLKMRRPCVQLLGEIQGTGMHARVKNNVDFLVDFLFIFRIDQTRSLAASSERKGNDAVPS